MKKIFYPLQILWAWYYFIVFAILFFIFYPAFLITLSRESWYVHANKLRVTWAWVLFVLTGIIPQVHYEKKLDKKKTYVFCPNHFSYLDIPMSAVVVRKNWRFMAKSELNNIPMLNIFFRTVDISVNRENARESFKSVREASDSLDKNFNIVIYPEGAIGDYPPNLLHFKNGPFKLAIEKQVPVVPVTMLDNWKLLYVHGWKFHGRPGRARVVVHEPIETTGMTIADMDELKKKVFHVISSQLNLQYAMIITNQLTI